MAGLLQGNAHAELFSEKLKAWWHGDVLPEQKKTRPPTASAKAAPPLSPKQIRPPDPWSEEAVEVAQAIWGAGFCGPCGAAYMRPLSNQLNLQPRMSLLQLGAGLGGPAHALAAYNKVNITGYEASKTLVQMGQAYLKSSQTPNKPLLRQYNPEQIPGFAQVYDGAFSEEALFNVADKENLLEKIVERIRPGGRIALTEYVLSSDAVMGRESYKDWSKGERLHPHLVLAEDLCDMLSDLHMQIHVSEDQSGQHISMIKNAWKDIDHKAASLAKNGGGVGQIQLLMKEAAYWMQRKKMLRMGDLKRWRIVAKKKVCIKTLSDW